MAKHHTWTQEELDMLGKHPDGYIAEQLGISPQSVYLRRKRYAIPACHRTNSSPELQRIVISPENAKKLEALRPYVLQEFNRRGVTVKDVTPVEALEFILDQAASAFKKVNTRALYTNQTEPRDEKDTKKDA